MRLTIVGCSGSYPGPDSACSSYLVEHDGFRLLLDLGNGALGPLQRHSDPRNIDAIYVSHLHGDHWLDLVPMFYALRHHPAGPSPRVPVYAPPGARGLLGVLLGKSVVEIEATFGFEEIPGLVTGIGPFEVRMAQMVHSAECHAIRLDAGGRSLVYSGDAAPSANLVELARGANVLLCEASFLDGVDNPPGIHMTGSQAAEQAREAGVDRLILTHLVPWYDRLRVLADAGATNPSGGLPIELARPGSVYDV